MSTTEQPTTIEDDIDDIEYHLIDCQCYQCDVNRIVELIEERRVA